MSSPTPPPGWYPAPDGHTGQQWWDGTAWTPHLAPTGTAEPPRTPQNPHKNKGILLPAIGAALGLTAVTLVGIYQFNRINSPTTPSAEELRISAATACEGAVGQNLKAPATASYNSNSTDLTSTSWSVTGTVDSENSFGALIRSTYSCTVTYDEATNTMNATLDHLE